MKVINEKLVKKTLDMFIDINKFNETNEDELDVDDDELDAMTPADRETELQKARDKQLAEKRTRFDTFYREFGKALKLGVIEDASNRKKLASLLRFKSSKYNNLTSFDEYLARMKDTQDEIYYMVGEREASVRSTPVFRKLANLDYEILICEDPSDEYVFNHVREYEGTKLKDIGKADFVLPTEDESTRKRTRYLESMFSPLMSYIQKILSEHVSKVTVSGKGLLEPCNIVAASGGFSAYMEKVNRASAFSKKNNDPKNEQLR